MLAPYDNWSNRSAIYGFVKDIPANESHETWAVLEDIESRLPALKDLPIQLIWGMQDWCFRPECLERFCNIGPTRKFIGSTRQVISLSKMRRRKSKNNGRIFESNLMAEMRKNFETQALSG